MTDPPRASEDAPDADSLGATPPKRPRLGKRLRARWDAVLAMSPLWLVLFLAAGTYVLSPRLVFFGDRLEAGRVAQRSYTAPEDLLVPDLETTQEKQQRARDAVLPVYDLDAGFARSLDERIRKLFEIGRAGMPKDLVTEAGQKPPDFVTYLQSQVELHLTEQDVDLFGSYDFSADLEDRLRTFMAQVLARGVVANKDLLLENRVSGIHLRNVETGAEEHVLNLFDYLGYPQEVEEFIAAVLPVGGRYSAAERAALKRFLVGNITPNVHPNRHETLARKDEAAAAAEEVFNQVQKGQVIVRKGDRIDPAEARILHMLYGAPTRSSFILPLLGRVVLLGFAALLLWLGPAEDKQAHKGSARLFSERLLLMALFLLMARFGLFLAGALSGSLGTQPFTNESSWLYLIPYASLALVSSLLYGRQSALLMSVVFAVLVALTGVDKGLEITVYTLVGSLAAIYSLERHQFRQRSTLLAVGVVIGAVNVAAILMLQALSGEELPAFSQLGFSLACGFFGGLACFATASFVIPVLEALLSITTDIRLVELSNTNLPLLRRLAFEAPGTFQHSLMVANLSKAGCAAIGADAVLTYTGALYHDVGKVYRPEYFIENQRPGFNRHDHLAPSMSAQIVISHIQDGLDLAEEHRLPKPILDAIAQHHGTRLISFFYNRALEQAGGDTSRVREEKYRYPGPPPSSKEMGVLMLADGVEAASRTLVEPTEGKIRSVIRAIVDDCVSDGQLDDTSLTLADLKNIGDAFARVLGNIFHQRVDYPGFEFNDEPAPVAEISPGGRGA